MKMKLIIVALFTLGLVAGVVSASPYTIEGNKVFINDSKVYISQEPHTITKSGYVYEETLSKIYSGPIRVAYGFKDTKTRPKSLEVDIGGNWVDLSDKFTEKWYSYSESYVWFVSDNLTVNAGTTYDTRMWLNIYPNASGKYEKAIWDASYGLDFMAAINDGKFYILDPWYSSNYTFRMLLSNHTDDNLSLVVNGTSGFTLNGSTQTCFVDVNTTTGDPAIYFNNNTDWTIANDTDILNFDCEVADIVGNNPLSIYDDPSQIISSHLNASTNINLLSNVTLTMNSGSIVTDNIGLSFNQTISDNVTAPLNSWNGGTEVDAYSVCGWTNVYSRAGVTDIWFAKQDAETYLEGVATDTEFRWRHRESDNTFNTVIIGDFSLPSGWFHFCATWDGSDVVSIYKNGVLANTTSGVPDFNTAGTAQMTLGCNPGFCSSNYVSAGWDELRVYLRELSAQEVQSLYTNGITLGAVEQEAVLPTVLRVNVTDEDNIGSFFGHFNVTVSNNVNITTSVVVTANETTFNNNTLPPDTYTVTLSVDGYTTRQYSVTTDNSTQLNLTGYLLANSDVLTQAIVINDIFNQPIENATLVLERFLGTNWTTVDVRTSDSFGSIVLQIKAATTYRATISASGFNNVTSTFTRVANTITFVLGVENVPDYFQWLKGQITALCTETISPRNVSCVLTDNSGLVVNTTLNVKRLQNLTFTQVCNVEDLAAPFSSHCDLTSQNASFIYNYFATTSEGTFLIESGQMDFFSAPVDYGTTGVFITLFLFLISSGLFIANKVAGILMGVLAISVAFTIGFINLGSTAFWSVILVSLIILYYIGKGSND